jgi:hypothetical protein
VNPIPTYGWYSIGINWHLLPESYTAHHVAGPGGDTERGAHFVCQCRSPPVATGEVIVGKRGEFYHGILPTVPGMKEVKEVENA